MNDTALRTTLVLRRTIAAPRERVFRAWTDPAVLRTWFGPMENTIPDARLDVRVGGTYRVVFEDARGERAIVRGVYRDVREPDRLAFTWCWEEDDAALEHETLVTLDVLPAAARTELILTHDDFTSEASRDDHAIGWTETLAKLASTLSGF